MPEKSLTIEQILALLTEAPQSIAALTQNLTPAQLRTNPGPDEWSANDILSHLRSCADVWGNCIAIILSEDMPTIRASNPTATINQKDYPQLEFRDSLQAFTKQRKALVAVLKQLPQQAWERDAIVTGAGKTLHRTVFSYAQWLATHERSHVKQIGRIARSMHA